MTIYLKKFGSILLSRPSGKEAWLAFQPTLNNVKPKEKIVLDFSDVDVLAPSWADEFITPLRKKFGKLVELLGSKNASVKATLTILNKT